MVLKNNIVKFNAPTFKVISCVNKLSASIHNFPDRGFFANGEEFILNVGGNKPNTLVRTNYE